MRYSRKSVIRSKRRSRAKQQAGFTLIEMMFTVAIIGVLAAIAAPSYGYYTLTARRTEAVIGLHHVWDLQQAFYHGHGETYAGDFDTLGFTTGDRIDAYTREGRLYTYRISRPWGEKSWYVSATANLDGDDWPDVLITGYQPPE